MKHSGRVIDASEAGVELCARLLIAKMELKGGLGEGQERPGGARRSGRPLVGSHWLAKRG